MTLIVAADVQDHLILAGDHCAVLSEVSNPAGSTPRLFNHRKVAAWKYGAIAGSGDIPLSIHFQRLLLQHAALSRPLQILDIALQAKAICTYQGMAADQSVANIFFTLPGRNGFQLYMVSILETRVTLDILDPISTYFSLRKEAALNEAAYHAINGRLQPSFFFGTIEQFHLHHIELLCALYAQQSATDPFVTSSFDVFILDKRTGEGRFWQTAFAAPERACGQATGHYAS